jgi:hypothetical protein
MIAGLATPLWLAVAAAAGAQPQGVAAATAATTAPAAAAPQVPLREQLPGGPELVVLPVRGATTVSLRLVFRVGSAMDPPGKEGLAHLVEHLLVEGAPGRPRLLDAARGVGARMNAFTSRDATAFVLDGPSAGFWPLAERLVRAVTSPSLQEAELGRQLGIVRSEHDYVLGGSDAQSLLEEALFRAPEIGPIGRASSRARIRRDDVLDWYQRSYLASVATLVVAGDVTPERARALARTAFLLPPPLPGETVAPRPAAASLPLAEKIPAPLIAFVHGYRFALEDRAACEGLAELVQLRMLVALTVRQPDLALGEARCVELRGNLFLLAFGYSWSLEAADVPDKMARIFAEAKTYPAGPRERAVIEQRLARAVDLVRADPAALADGAAGLAARPRAEGATPLPFTAPPLTAPAALQAAARRAFLPEREIRVVVSPLEG